MFFAIESANGLPIYDQIVRQVTFAVAQGAVRPGERIPSVRDLAKQLAVNPNTVARAYRELQGAGVVETVRGMGLEVANGATAACKTQRERLVRERLRGVIVEAERSGLDADRIRSIVEEELGRRQRKGARA